MKRPEPTPEEVAAWEALSPQERFDTIGAALDRGIAKAREAAEEVTP